MKKDIGVAFRPYRQDNPLYPLREAGKMKATTVLNRIHFISALLACSFLGFQLIIISVNVIMRYFFSSGISWMEEIAKDVLMPAFTFLSMAIGVKMDLHINVNIIPNRAPRWITLVLLKLKHSVLALIGVVLLWYGTSLIFSIKASIATLPMLPASLQFVAIPLAGLLIACDSIMSLLGMEKNDVYLNRKFMSGGDENG
jgi:TRAP-type C4-dicarboxylate transport system permease small subunit